MERERERRKWNFIGESSDDVMMISLFLLLARGILFIFLRAWLRVGESPSPESGGDRR